MLDASSAWFAGSNDAFQYIIIDLDIIRTVYGSIIQGTSHYDVWVKTYKVSFSTDNITYLYITTTGTTTDTNLAQIFTGTQDQHTMHIKVVSIFNSTIQARYIKYHPVTWYAGISMRAGVLIIPPTPSVNWYFDRWLITIESQTNPLIYSYNGIDWTVGSNIKMLLEKL